VIDVDVDVEKEVRRIISERLKVSEAEISLESSLIKDLQADSLDIVEMMRLEERFDIQIRDEDIPGLDTVGRVVSYVQQKLKEKES